MDSPQPPQSTLETLRTVEFRLGLKGYNVDEVDEYLEKAAVEAEALQEQVRQVTDRLRQAAERVAQLEAERREAPPEPQSGAADAGIADESLQRTLLLAQKFVDQAKRESEAEATDLVTRAESRAQATLAEAEERARQMTTEAEQRLREEVARLESIRGQLASDVENMARHLESERNRLHSTLSEILTWVDENIQPANSLMALRPRTVDQARPPAPPRPAAPRPAPAPAPQQQAPQQQSPAAGGASGAPQGAGSADIVAQVLDLRGAATAGGRPPGERS